MSMIVWILLGLGLGLITSKIVRTTGEGTVVDSLIGIVGALAGGWLFDLFRDSSTTGFDIDIYGGAAAVIVSIALLAIYHAFFRRRML